MCGVVVCGADAVWVSALFAAHALSLNIILITNNTKEFIRVPNLLVENWVLG